MNIIRVPKPPNGLKSTIRPFFTQNRTLLKERKSATLCMCKNCQRQNCKAFTGLSIRARMIGEGRPLLHENLANTDPPLQNANFQSIFARSASAVTASENSSINTNRKSGKTTQSVHCTMTGPCLRMRHRPSAARRVYR